MSGQSKYLTQLSSSSGSLQDANAQDRAPVQPSSRGLTTISEAMPPPATRPELPPQGTILDDAPFQAADIQTPMSTFDHADKAHYKLADWSAYFDGFKDIQLADRQGTFRVYMAGSAGPVVFCLHGGGYTALTWAMLAKQLKGRCRLMAFDQRGHGETVTEHDDNLSAEALAADAVAVWKAIYAQEQPPIVLVGHSMGGAVAVRTAATKEVANLQGLVVIDVVEGTAISSLPHMVNVLRQRPSSFTSLQDAVHWARKSGMSKSTEAACISMPSCLRQQKQQSPIDMIDNNADVPGGGCWVWRTPLAASQPYWEGWYRGLSDLFLYVTIPKVLVLAGTDRLDRSLTIGQMQGKFQLVLLPQAGHAVHEDQHEKTAEVVANFIQRFRIGLPKMQIPKAGEGSTRVLPVAVGPAFVRD